MLLLLVRHADAGERDPARWPDDTLRPLTEKGRKVQGEVMKALRDAGVAPEVVLTSPWLRAVQTAELLTQGLGIAPRCAGLPAGPSGCETCDAPVLSPAENAVTAVSAAQSSFCPKIAMLEECPGFTFIFGLI